MILDDTVRSLFRKLRCSTKIRQKSLNGRHKTCSCNVSRNTIDLTMRKPTNLFNREFNTLVHSKPSGNNDPASGERNTKHTFCHTHDAKL